MKLEDAEDNFMNASFPVEYTSPVPRILQVFMGVKERKYLSLRYASRCREV